MMTWSTPRLPRSRCRQRCVRSISRNMKITTITTALFRHARSACPFLPKSLRRQMSPLSGHLRQRLSLRPKSNWKPMCLKKAIARCSTSIVQCRCARPLSASKSPPTNLLQLEPVVIFPGQDTRGGMRFARPAELQPQAEPAPDAPTAPQSGVTPLRRFDPPAAADPAAVGKPVPAQDPAEAERALRSALATLQRMSGAA